MKYNICFNDSSVNKIIIDVLKNLDNIFFVECLDSENNEEPNISLDVELISDNDNEISINILNEFSFVD
ncbi:21972_t:CDS:1, partial [Cetraspora pellucida]